MVVSLNLSNFRTKDWKLVPPGIVGLLAIVGLLHHPVPEHRPGALHGEATQQNLNLIDHFLNLTSTEHR